MAQTIVENLQEIHSWELNAFELEREGKYREATAIYERCRSHLDKIVPMMDDKRRKVVVGYLLKSLSARIEALKTPITEAEMSADGEEAEVQEAGGRETSCTATSTSAPATSAWAEIHGLENTKSALCESVLLVFRYPRAFSPPHARKPWSKILLYGPPGTGKTHLAKALASELCGVHFQSISSADILSCWLGKSEQKVVQIFEEAKKKPGGCVLFLDEIDSLCRKRSESEDEATRRVKNELLKQLDGVEYNPTQGSVLLVLASTNRPWELDSAVLRRFERRIHVPMPDVAARAAFLTRKLDGSSLDTADVQDLAIRTAGFNCADLSVLVNDGLMEAVREMDQATHWRVVTDPSDPNAAAWVPCSPDYPDAVAWDHDELDPKKKLPRPATKSDLEKALARTRPSISAEENALYDKWTETMGQRG